MITPRSFLLVNAMHIVAAVVVKLRTVITVFIVFIAEILIIVSTELFQLRCR